MTCVLVTGGAGFVGSSVVDELVARGDDVRVVDCLHPAAHRRCPDYLNAGAEYVWGDLRDPDVASRVTAGVDAVCHQASMVGLGVDFSDVTDYVAHNDAATATLLRALHHHGFAGRTVLASSMVVYGDGRYHCARHGVVVPEPRRVDDLASGFWEARCPVCACPLEPEAISEDAPGAPRNVYAATKLHQEHLVAAYAREHASPFVALRYHNVYGPRMPRDTPYAGVASIFRSALQRGDAPLVFEDGLQRRDFVHVSDVAAANVLALSAAPAVGGAFNIASGETCTLHDMACELAHAFGPNAPVPQIVGRYRLGDVRHVFGSTERAQRDLRFRAAVGRREGLAAFARQELRP